MLRIGLLGSLLLHTVLLLWGMVTFPTPRPFVVVQSMGLPVELVPIESSARLQKGETIRPRKPPAQKRITSVSETESSKKEIKKTPPRPAKAAQTPPDSAAPSSAPKKPLSAAELETPQPQQREEKEASSSPSVPPQKDPPPPTTDETEKKLPEASQAMKAGGAPAISSGTTLDIKAAPVPKQEMLPSPEVRAEQALLEAASPPARRPTRSKQESALAKKQEASVRLPSFPNPPKETPPLQKQEEPKSKQKEKEKKANFDPESIAALLNKVTPSGERASVAQEEGPENVSQFGVRSAQERQQVSLSQSEVEALKAQISACWNPPVGALAADNVVVVLRIFLEPDGRLFQDPELVNTTPHPLFEAMAESAKRALLMCQPYQLPPEKYEAWNTATITFDLREMLGG